MNLQRREEIRKMCAGPARGGTQGAKQIYDLRDAVTEAFAHIDTLEQAAAERVIADGGRGPTPGHAGEGSAWVPPVEARAVVVPELPTWEDSENKLRRGEKLTALEKFVIDHDWHKTDTTFRDGLEAVFAELRTIPADRVPGEGMVAVDREELHQLRGLESCARAVMAYDGLLGTEERNRLKRLDAIRANQGGAAT